MSGEKKTSSKSFWESLYHQIWRINKDGDIHKRSKKDGDSWVACKQTHRPIELGPWGPEVEGVMTSFSDYYAVEWSRHITFFNGHIMPYGNFPIDRLVPNCLTQIKSTYPTKSDACFFTNHFPKPTYFVGQCSDFWSVIPAPNFFM